MYKFSVFYRALVSEVILKASQCPGTRDTVLIRGVLILTQLECWTLNIGQSSSIIITFRRNNMVTHRPHLPVDPHRLYTERQPPSQQMAPIHKHTNKHSIWLSLKEVLSHTPHPPYTYNATTLAEIQCLRPIQYSCHWACVYKQSGVQPHSTYLYHRLSEVSMEIHLSKAEQRLFNEQHNTPSFRGHLRNKALTVKHQIVHCIQCLRTWLTELAP